jgi:hypothetical protein
MERVRGLPFFISYASQNQRVDVLDLYFPSLGAGYVAGSGQEAFRFTTTCSASSPASATCSSGLPAGYSVSYQAQFVRANQTATTETYTPIAPPAAYVWNSPTNDKPPTQLLRMTVVARWTMGGRARSYSLTSLIGDRKVAADRLLGSGRADYLVQILGSYDDAVGDTVLSLRGGLGESRIESRLLSQSSVNATAGEARLTRAPTLVDDSAQEIGSLQGATSVYAAPPDTANPAPTTSRPLSTLLHSGLSNAPVASFAESATTTPLKATVSAELPAAAGGFAFTNPSSIFDLWVNNQAEVGGAQRLNHSQLTPAVVPAKPLLNVERLSGVTINGATSASVGALGTAGRGARTTASGGFGQFNLLPVDFIAGDNPHRRAVIQISGFASAVDCNSTANTATATATATYSATLRFWAENDWVAGDPARQRGDGTTAGGYRTITLSGANLSDPLAVFNATSPNDPLVWEDNVAANDTGNGSPRDIYLFPITHQHSVLETHNHPGYLAKDTGWSSLFDLSGAGSVANGGRVTEARLGGAIRLNTTPLGIPESALNISVGNLNCSASDLR